MLISDFIMEMEKEKSSPQPNTGGFLWTLLLTIRKSDSEMHKFFMTLCDKEGGQRREQPDLLAFSVYFPRCDARGR